MLWLYNHKVWRSWTDFRTVKEVWLIISTIIQKREHAETLICRNAVELSQTLSTILLTLWEDSWKFTFFNLLFLRSRWWEISWCRGLYHVAHTCIVIGSTCRNCQRDKRTVEIFRVIKHGSLEIFVEPVLVTAWRLVVGVPVTTVRWWVDLNVHTRLRKWDDNAANHFRTEPSNNSIHLPR